MPSDIRRARTAWQDILLVCRKCTKKVDGGFGPKGKHSLRQALKAELGGGKSRKASLKVVEVGCFGVCPKGAVTVACGSRPGELLIVGAGTQIEELAKRVGRQEAPKRRLPAPTIPCSDGHHTT